MKSIIKTLALAMLLVPAVNTRAAWVSTFRRCRNVLTQMLGILIIALELQVAILTLTDSYHPV